MNTDTEKLYSIAEDILSTGGIIYNMCKDDDSETVIKIRPLAELIAKKADKLCVALLNLQK